jgi:hypothetical protein
LQEQGTKKAFVEEKRLKLNEIASKTGKRGRSDFRAAPFSNGAMKLILEFSGFAVKTRRSIHFIDYLRAGLPCWITPRRSEPLPWPGAKIAVGGVASATVSSALAPIMSPRVRAVNAAIQSHPGCNDGCNERCSSVESWDFMSFSFRSPLDAVNVLHRNHC